MNCHHGINTGHCLDCLSLLANTRYEWIKKTTEENRVLLDENEKIKAAYVVLHNSINDLLREKEVQRSDIIEYQRQVLNLTEDNKVLRAAIATVGSIVKIAEQL